jgi:hypothetical protein
VPAKSKTKHDVELRRSHDAMARFLLRLIRQSDEQEDAGCPRRAGAENEYQEALRLIRKAGLEYTRRAKRPEESSP